MALLRPLSRTGTLALTVFVTALALRLPFLPARPETPDGVRFARALERFDVVDFAPHFPGYPLAVFLARLAPGDGARSLAGLGALAAAVTAAAWVLLDRSARGLAAGWAIAVFPFLVRASCVENTDTLVIPFLFFAVITMRRWPLLAGVLLGLGLGVRPSVFPFAVVALVAPSRVRCVAGLAGGVLLWLLPTLVLTGPEAYFLAGRDFLRGHFLEWGGTSLGAGEGRVAGMATGWLLRPLGWSYFAGPAVWLAGALLLAGAAVALRRLRPHGFELRVAGLGLLVHGAWLCAAQNPEHSRHALLHWYALVGLAGAGLGMLAARSRAVRPAVTACLAGALGASLVTQLDWRATPVPTHQALRWVEAAGFDPAADVLLAQSDRALWRFAHPDWPVHGAPEPAVAVAGLPVTPAVVWWTRVDRDPGPPPGGFDRSVEFHRAPFLGDWGHTVRAYRAADAGAANRRGLP